MVSNNFMPMLDFDDMAKFYQVNTKIRALLTENVDYDYIFAKHIGNFMDPNRRAFLNRISEKYTSFPVVLKTVKNFEACKEIKFKQCKSELNNTYERFNKELQE